MQTIVGIFKDRQNAEHAMEALRAVQPDISKLALLMPGDAPWAGKTVQTTDAEQPGMGKVLGGVVGGALGAAAGSQLGSAIATVFLSGVGPIMTSGILGAVLLGVGGVAGGAIAGQALESSLEHGLPRDELYLYEDALRDGRAVVMALVEAEQQAESARRILIERGAESLDAARDRWWIGLRDAEAEVYEKNGLNFTADEPRYRLGFEAAMRAPFRGRAYADVKAMLQARYPDAFDREAFRIGYERGLVHDRTAHAKKKEEIQRQR